MNKLYALVISTFLLNVNISIYGQLADGSIAPDFTLTDIDGKEHTLYDYLDAGYTVVLDFSATWCGPCWDYHSTHVLRDLYTNHGPAGAADVSENTTDDVMVIFIEADGSTTNDDLYGPNWNWVEGTTYPIIDDGAIGSTYNISSFPTLVSICPSKILTAVSQVSEKLHYENAYVCGYAEYESDARVVDLTSLDTFCEDYSPIVRIQNLGTDNTLSEATIKISQNGTELSSTDWSGSLETYDYAEVVVEPISNMNGSLPISVSIETGVDDNAPNNTVNPLVSRFTTLDKIHLELQADDYGSETSWDITDASGNVVAQGSNYTANQLVNEEIELSSFECHTFNLYDSFGDGICCIFGEGYATLSDSQGNLIYTITEFTTGESVVFENGIASGIESAVEVTEVSVFPNPAQDLMNLSFSLSQNAKTKIEFYNILGELIYTQDVGELTVGMHTMVLDIENVPTGSYALTISSETGTTTKRVVVQK